MNLRTTYPFLKLQDCLTMSKNRANTEKHLKFKYCNTFEELSMLEMKSLRHQKNERTFAEDMNEIGIKDFSDNISSKGSMKISAAVLSEKEELIDSKDGENVFISTQMDENGVIDLFRTQNKTTEDRTEFNLQDYVTDDRKFGRKATDEQTEVENERPFVDNEKLFVGVIMNQFQIKSCQYKNASSDKEYDHDDFKKGEINEDECEEVHTDKNIDEDERIQSGINDSTATGTEIETTKNNMLVEEIKYHGIYQSNEKVQLFSDDMHDISIETFDESRNTSSENNAKISLVILKNKNLSDERSVENVLSAQMDKNSTMELFSTQNEAEGKTEVKLQDSVLDAVKCDRNATEEAIETENKKPFGDEYLLSYQFQRKLYQNKNSYDVKECEYDGFEKAEIDKDENVKDHNDKKIEQKKSIKIQNELRHDVNINGAAEDDTVEKNFLVEETKYQGIHFQPTEINSNEEDSLVEEIKYQGINFQPTEMNSNEENSVNNENNHDVVIQEPDIPINANKIDDKRKEEKFPEATDQINKNNQQNEENSIQISSQLKNETNKEEKVYEDKNIEESGNRKHENKDTNGGFNVDINYQRAEDITREEDKLLDGRNNFQHTCMNDNVRISAEELQTKLNFGDNVKNTNESFDMTASKTELNVQKSTKIINGAELKYVLNLGENATNINATPDEADLKTKLKLRDNVINIKNASDVTEPNVGKVSLNTRVAAIDESVELMEDFVNLNLKDDQAEERRESEEAVEPRILLSGIVENAVNKVILRESRPKLSIMGFKRCLKRKEMEPILLTPTEGNCDYQKSKESVCPKSETSIFTATDSVQQSLRKLGTSKNASDFTALEIDFQQPNEYPTTTNLLQNITIPRRVESNEANTSLLFTSLPFNGGQSTLSLEAASEESTDLEEIIGKISISKAQGTHIAHTLSPNISCPSVDSKDRIKEVNYHRTLLPTPHAVYSKENTPVDNSRTAEETSLKQNTNLKKNKPISKAKGTSDFLTFLVPKKTYDETLVIDFNENQLLPAVSNSALKIRILKQSENNIKSQKELKTTKTLRRRRSFCADNEVNSCGEDENREQFQNSLDSKSTLHRRLLVNRYFICVRKTKDFHFFANVTKRTKHSSKNIDKNSDSISKDVHQVHTEASSQLRDPNITDSPSTKNENYVENTNRKIPNRNAENCSFEFQTGIEQETMNDKRKENSTFAVTDKTKAETDSKDMFPVENSSEALSHETSTSSLPAGTSDDENFHFHASTDESTDDELISSTGTIASHHTFGSFRSSAVESNQDITKNTTEWSSSLNFDDRDQFDCTYDHAFNDCGSRNGVDTASGISDSILQNHERLSYHFKHDGLNLRFVDDLSSDISLRLISEKSTSDIYSSTLSETTESENNYLVIKNYCNSPPIIESSSTRMISDDDTSIETDERIKKNDDKLSLENNALKTEILKFDFKPEAGVTEVKFRCQRNSTILQCKSEQTKFYFKKRKNLKLAT